MAHIRTKGEGRTRRYEVIWHQGSRRRSKTHLREKDAKAHWLELERRARLGSLYEAPPETFGGFADGWLERYTPGLAPSTVIKAKAARGNLAPLDELTLSAITGAVLEDCIAAVARRAPRQGQLALSYAKQILRDAQARGHEVHAAALRV